MSSSENKTAGVRGIIAGMGLGGGLGAASGYASGKDKKDKRNRAINSGIRGGIAGGFLGSMMLGGSHPNPSGSRYGYRDYNKGSSRGSSYGQGSKNWEKEWEDAFRRAGFNTGGHGGGHGGSYGGSYGRASRASGATFEESLSHLGATGKEKTKAEIKKKYREMAMKHHPDRGGSEDMMKKVNTAWDSIQEEPWFQKLAFDSNPFLNGFLKRATGWGTAAELGGLGTLAIPSIQHLRGKPMSADNTAKLEIAGLGTLAAPYVAGGIRKGLLARAARSAVTRGHG